MRSRPTWKNIVLLSAAAVLTACSADDVAAQDLAVVGPDTDTREIPDAVTMNDAFAESSARFLGVYDGLSYFVARLATAPEHAVCLVEFESASHMVSSACSDVLPGHSDRIVTLRTTNTDSEISLVRDHADPVALEGGGWSRVAENLWARGQ